MILPLRSSLLASSSWSPSSAGTNGAGGPPSAQALTAQVASLRVAKHCSFAVGNDGYKQNIQVFTK